MFFILTFCSANTFAQQTPDTAYIDLYLDAMAFFDNKEFTNGIKKGYTLPGFWHSDGFVTPRGEEIYGSISTRGTLHNERHRRLLTLQAGYTYSVLSGFDLRFSAGAYATSASQIDYFYTFTMGFNGALYSRNR